MASTEIDTNSLDRALGFWSLGIQYLHLAESAASEIVVRGNVCSMVFDGLDFEKQQVEFDEATKWADHSLGIPVIFNFYHGLELCLKGLLSSRHYSLRTHKLTDLLRDCSSEYEGTDFLGIADRYIDTQKMSGPISEFFEGNGINVDSWYEALKYPELISGKPLRDRALRYRGEKGAKFYDDLQKDISKFRIDFVAYTRKMHQDLP